MFNRYVYAVEHKERKLLVLMFFCALGIFGVMGLGLLVYQFWKIEKLEHKIAIMFSSSAKLTAPPPPPPSPPAPPALPPVPSPPPPSPPAPAAPSSQPYSSQKLP